MADDDDDDSKEPPWYAPGHAESLQGKGSAPRPREHVWTLVNAGRRLDASLMFHGESYGWEAQVMDGDYIVCGRRFPLKAGGLAETHALRNQFIRDGWQRPTR